MTFALPVTSTTVPRFGDGGEHAERQRSRMACFDRARDRLAARGASNTATGPTQGGGGLPTSGIADSCGTWTGTIQDSGRIEGTISETFAYYVGQGPNWTTDLFCHESSIHARETVTRRSEDKMASVEPLLTN